MTGQCDEGCDAGWGGVLCDKGNTVCTCYNDYYKSSTDAEKNNISIKINIFNTIYKNNNSQRHKQ